MIELKMWSSYAEISPEKIEELSRKQPTPFHQ